MMGATHISLAMAGGLLLKMEPLFLIIFCIGSVFPDKLDFFFSAGSREAWKKIHRTWSHSWWFIGLVAIGSYFLVSWFIVSLRPEFYLAKLCVIYFFSGMLFHIICDVFTPAGIPFMYPSGKKRGLGIVTSRGMGNTVLFFVGVTISGYLIWTRYFVGTDLFVVVSNLISKFIKLI